MNLVLVFNDKPQRTPRTTKTIKENQSHKRGRLGGINRKSLRANRGFKGRTLLDLISTLRQKWKTMQTENKMNVKKN